MKKIIYILIISFLLIGKGNCMIYYVSPKGLDTNVGTNISAPLKTIQAGIDKAIVDNDEVKLFTGVYNEKIVITQNSIKISAYELDKPVIDGGITLPSSPNSALITLIGNYNTLSGIEVKNANLIGKVVGGYGINAVGHHNTLSNLIVHDTWDSGINVLGDNTVIEDSQIYLTALSSSITHLTWGNGITIGSNSSLDALQLGITTNTICRRNTLYNNWGEAILVKESDHTIIEDNIIYDNWTTGLLHIDSTNSTIQRNLIYNSSKSDISKRNNLLPAAIVLTDKTALKTRSQNSVIINNNIYNANVLLFESSDIWNSGFVNSLFANNTIVLGKLNTGATTNGIVNVNSRIKNNIIQNSTTLVSSIPTNAGISFTNNNWLINPPTTAVASTNVIGDAKLYKYGLTSAGSMTGAYFRLLVGSGVIGKGVNLTEVTDDYQKTPRDTKTDIGAHEFLIPTNANPMPICKTICYIPKP